MRTCFLTCIVTAFFTSELKAIPVQERIFSLFKDNGNTYLRDTPELYNEYDMGLTEHEKNMFNFNNQQKISEDDIYSSAFNEFDISSADNRKSSNLYEKVANTIVNNETPACKACILNYLNKLANVYQKAINCYNNDVYGQPDSHNDDEFHEDPALNCNDGLYNCPALYQSPSSYKNIGFYKDLPSPFSSSNLYNNPIFYKGSRPWESTRLFGNGMGVIKRPNNPIMKHF